MDILKLITDTFLNASIVALIIVAALQLFKIVINRLGFSKVKEKHKTFYKTFYTLLTYIFTAAGIFINAFYISGLSFIWTDQIFLTEFILNASFTLLNVFFLYNGLYEGVGIKSLVKLIINKLSKLNKDNDNSLTDVLDKINANEELKELINLLPDNDKELNKAIKEIKDGVNDEINKAKDKAKEEVKSSFKVGF